MQETKKYIELRKKEKQAFNVLIKSFKHKQFPLFHKYLDAKHLAEMESLNILFKE